MTLQQLSYQYQEQAQALHQRIDLLRRAQARCGDRESAEHLQRRIRDLEPLHRQTRQLATMTGGIAKMHITPSEAYDPIDIASLCLWKQAQSGDNQDRIRRLLCNLPLAVQQELTPRQREILRMRFTGGMSVTAIARELGLNKSTVSRSLARSMERLYRSLRYSL